MKFIKDRKGVTSIEYAIIASMLSIVIVIGVTMLGETNGASLDQSAEKLNDAFNTASGTETK